MKIPSIAHLQYNTRSDFFSLEKLSEVAFAHEFEDGNRHAVVSPPPPDPYGGISATSKAGTSWAVNNQTNSTWSGGSSYCSNLGGGSGWRLPSRAQLQSLNNAGGFSGQFAFYWSSTADTANSLKAWTVGVVMSSSDVYSRPKDEVKRIICVHPGS